MSSPTFRLASPFFQPEGFLLPRDTAQGENVSPKLDWVHPPEGTRSYVLIMEHRNGAETPCAHWIQFDIPSCLRRLPEGHPAGNAAINDFGSAGYHGPCPPAGVDHRFEFALYALDVESLRLPPQATRNQVLRAMRGHVLGIARLVAHYEGMACV